MRNKMICILILYIYLLMSLSLHVYADDFSLIINVDVENYRITFKGNSGSVPSQVINAVVVTGNDEPNGYNVISVDATRTVKNGSFLGEMILNTNIEAGIYTIFVSSKNGGGNQRFIIINENDSKVYLNTLNTKTVKTEFFTYLMQNAEKFGIFADEYSECEPFVSDILFARKPANGYVTVKSVYNKLRTSKVVYELISDANVEKTLTENSEVLNIDVEAYLELSANTKTFFNGLLINADYIAKDFSEIYEKNYIYAVIAKSEKWTNMKTNVLKYAKETGISLTGDYTKLNYPDEVFKEMFRKGVTSFDNIRSCFNDSVSSCYSSEKSSVNTGTGGKGGGSGGGSGFVSTVSEVPASANKLNVFSDMSGHWAYSYINALSGKGIINGFSDGTFKPDNNITRAEFTKILVMAFEINGSSDIYYSDVGKNEWYFSYVNAAATAGIIIGYNEKFSPQDYITRQDAAVILYRTLLKIGIESTHAAGFSDYDEISDYAKEAVATLASLGIINGNRTGFSPQMYITRAETSKIIELALEVHSN